MADGSWEVAEDRDADLTQARRALAMAITLHRFYLDALNDAEDELAEVLGRTIEAREALEAATDVLTQRIQEYENVQAR